ncbi:hypothetical protein FQN60_004184 [Etheostoma spectabile]|uniref:Voltage-dependent calcium channel gamma-2 subunit n=1 Tax=Etheostoma spectabile TaxID=54343 RepID=A0A5J5CY32_9PERO|nr:hypothetical protein FQN60_004184 [Etheostoma spectabile]
MGLFDRGVQMLLTTVGAFAAFSLMTIAVGTDYWLYSRGVCRSKSMNENETSKKNEEVMTHSGLWRTCCLEATDGRSLIAAENTDCVFGSAGPHILLTEWTQVGDAPPSGCTVKRDRVREEVWDRNGGPCDEGGTLWMRGRPEIKADSRATEEQD